MIINATAHHLPFPNEVFHTIVTSPPYFGLRQYAGMQELDWPGGAYSPMTGVPCCVEVPAWHGGFGSEPTVEMYVWHTILVCRELWRVLRNDGVFWLNLGDSYCGYPANVTRGGELSGATQHARQFKENGYGLTDKSVPNGNLLGIPHRVMLALQADGWIVRNDNIWAKKACMPESINGWRWEPNRCECVTDHRGTEAYRQNAYGDNPQTDHAADGSFATPEADPNCPICNGNGVVGEPILRQGSWRHTRSHEFVLMLTKQMGYYANAEVAKENVNGGTHDRGKKHLTPKTAENGIGIRQNESWQNSTWEQVKHRNPRTVITPTPSPWPGAHYAVFPPDLIAPLIRATTPARCCPHCGQAWAPVVEKRKTVKLEGYTGKKNAGRDESAARMINSLASARLMGGDHANPFDPGRVTGYRQTCNCPAHEPIPGLVFDPFFGSGTVGQVARELGLRYAGTDLSFEYLEGQAILRAEKKTPKQALDALPLFQISLKT